ncbi:Hypothetical Protein FCC1311_025722 [Hondaea fermentalgiana]|uniref:Uncharacterized protein n=1 Tax=Hondaea fermentalgiana TaxID=2315210 RepID=A0A2R5GDS1_9STRA|nr:Hypothetical Protein FCC1311_025722 [Hondaea fermentalgiana]|eukprot:GBG26351.1 Hypothetical Protein FCC1311_025722 [Hondaea fermentalgiana]
MDERTFAHEYAATRAPTASSKGHVEVVSKRAAKNTAAYPWERRQRLQDRNLAGSDSCKTRLDPSQEADLVAAISYAAAHQGDSTLPFTSPFAKEKLVYPTKDPALDTSSSNEADLARNRIVARFTIKLSKDEYYEVMRRKEVIKARERARHLLAVHEKESAKHREHLYRREDPYEPPQTRELGSKLRQADPSRWIHSKGFAA